MITRYTRPEMGRIWSEENKYKQWLEVELAASEALAELGDVPVEAARALREHARTNATRIAEIERETRHDVIAFTTCVAESMAAAGGAEYSRWLHYGLTSNDVVDTAQALQIKECVRAAAQGHSTSCSASSRRKLSNTRQTVMIGRTHGIHAEPYTFGLKFALWYDELRRDIGAIRTCGRGHSRRQNLGRRRHVRAHRPGGGGANLRDSGAETCSDRVPGNFARSSCGLYQRSGA